MIQRRFFLYFLVAAGLTVVATIVFEAYSLRRSVVHSVNQNQLMATGVAELASDLLKREERVLARALEEVAIEPLGREDVERRMRSLATQPTGDGLALFDGSDRILGSTLKAGLPDASILLPSLRHARHGHRLVVTDQWVGRDGHPRFAVLLGQEPDAGGMVLMSDLQLDGEQFLSMFRFFQLDAAQRLQVLDSRGIALFSSRPDERGSSVVHGTYLIDKVRGGRSVQMQCHSCHLDGGSQRPTRENEILTLAPVEGTNLSVAVREAEGILLAPIREVSAMSVGLVSVILGAFIGFYMVVSRSVLRPMHQLASAAAAVADGKGGNAVAIQGADEVAQLARSLESMRQRSQLSPMFTEEESMGIAELRPLLDGILDSLQGVGPVRSAICFLEGDPVVGRLFLTRGLDVAARGPVGRALQDASAGLSLVTVGRLGAHGISVRGAPDTRAFSVQTLRIGEGLSGQIWLGLSVSDTAQLQVLEPTLATIARQIESLLLRTLLSDQLRRENALKNRMLGHVFEAEAAERRWIAREIHDETSQALTALLLLLETFPIGADAEVQERSLDLAKRRVEDILDATDRLIHRLRPALLDDLGLVAAIQLIGDEQLEPSNVGYELSVSGEGTKLPEEVEEAVYRVFQEASTNVIRHSGATCVRAALRMQPGRLSAWFEDDGRGMDIERLSDDVAGWGLLGMRERIVQLGGQLDFHTSPGHGFKIELKVPFVTPPQSEDGDD